VQRDIAVLTGIDDHIGMMLLKQARSGDAK
jgi:hypothetical protein